ncbi:MAG: GTP diphosphokinase [Pseudomonadota bacterium]
MVKVREDLPQTEDGQVDLSQWIKGIEKRVPNLQNQHQLLEAAQLCRSTQNASLNSGHAWSGTPCFNTGLNMVDLLADLRLDMDALVAAMLYRPVREGQLALPMVHEKFGSTIAHLVEGVLRMAAISSFVDASPRPVLGQSIDQIGNLRKMLIAMVDDVRVALIKLVERTCAIRAVKHASAEKRERVAREVFEIYAPLAHRLGIGHIKWELEDLSFRYLHPEPYQKIAMQLDERRLLRQDYIDQVVNELTDVLKKNDIQANVSGRAKHIYSIWRKMQQKRVDFSQIYDIRAVRILVPSIRDCYSVLGLVHATWQHIPKEFDDYIARPKENGYRSLHTAVLGPSGRVIEVQIRTSDMHEEAELGVCAHWHYKEGTQGQPTSSHEGKIAWLRQVLEWHEELGETSVSELMSEFAHNSLEERIYVLTRDGHVVDMALGATPLDFAYHVHTEVGHRCRGARVNQRIVPLNHPLKTGDQVDIITAKENHPSRDWLNPNLGYVTTSRARAKIQNWFKLQDREQNLRDGRAMLEHELQRLSMSDISFEQIAEKLRIKSGDEVCVAFARGEIKVGQILNALQDAHPLVISEQELLHKRDSPPALHGGAEVIVDGVGDLLSRTAGCCQPVPGDEVLGYVSVGRGIIVHQQDCSEITRLQVAEPRRVIEIDWTHGDQRVYPVNVTIRSYDRQGLLRDISALLAAEKINVIEVQTLSNKRDGTASMHLTLETSSLGQLSRVLARISQLPNVFEVHRK